MPGTNEAFSRVNIDAQLKDQGWDVLNPNAVRFEYVLPDKTKADYVLCDRHGRALAVIEAKRAAINPAEAEVQAKDCAAQLKVPYVFLANGEEIRFWEWQREAFPRAIKIRKIEVIHGERFRAAAGRAWAWRRRCRRFRASRSRRESHRPALRPPG